MGDPVSRKGDTPFLSCEIEFSGKNTIKIRIWISDHFQVEISHIKSMPKKYALKLISVLKKTSLLKVRKEDEMSEERKGKNGIK